MNIRQALIALVLMLVAGFSGWLLFRDHSKDLASNFIGPPRADYILQNFELSSFNAKGKLSFSLHAPRLTHDDTRNIFDIDDPAFYFFDNEGKAWHANSGRARIHIENKTVAMRDQVMISNQTGDDAAFMHLSTEELDADTEAKILWSNVAVTLQKPGASLQSTGLEVDLNTKQFSLAANVRGRFEVPHD